jgi:hypothetical protein
MLESIQEQSFYGDIVMRGRFFQWQNSAILKVFPRKVDPESHLPKPTINFSNPRILMPLHIK